MNTYQVSLKSALQGPLDAAGACAAAADCSQPPQPKQWPAHRALAHGQCLALRPQVSGWLLRVLCGRAWVTVEGDPEDHVLTAGQAVCLPQERLTVAEAWGAQGATVVVREQGQEGEVRGAT